MHQKPSDLLVSAVVTLQRTRAPLVSLALADLISTAGKVRNFYLTTIDEEKLGTWHVLPNSAYDKAAKLGTAVPVEGPFAESVFDAALR